MKSRCQIRVTTSQSCLRLAKLTFEKYATIFSEIKAILNSRPLFKFSTDPNKQITVLTPGHFLIGTSLLQAPQSYVSPKLSLKTCWLFLKHFYNHSENNGPHNISTCKSNVISGIVLTLILDKTK